MTVATTPSISVWEDAPYWANFRAMDQDGQWCWFQSEPIFYHSTKANGVWYYNEQTSSAQTKYLAIAPNPEPVASFTASLERRPADMAN